MATPNGNPFANWLIDNQYPNSIEIQATDPAFGSTLPQPPDNGQGGSMTNKYEWLGRGEQTREEKKVRDGFPEPLTSTHVKANFSKPVKVNGVWTREAVESPESIYIPWPEGATIVNLTQYFGYEEETENPNPPPVLTLARGARGVDVSYWQGAYNWAESGAEFGIIRCSDGMTTNTTTHDEYGVDRQFWANAGKLTALGIPWAIYHFLRPGNIAEQAYKVGAALTALKETGQPPRTAVFDNGVMLPELFIDVEDGLLTSAQVQEFYNLLVENYTVGIYTGKPVWEQITNGVSVWWSSIPLWIANYGANDGNVPNYSPSLPRGWETAVLWQYSSNPIDKNIAGPYPLDKPDPPTPPAGEVVDLLKYFRGDGRIFELQNEADGSQERNQTQPDPNDPNAWFIAKGENQGMWERWVLATIDGVEYICLDTDTSPASAPSDGAERYYQVRKNGGYAPMMKRYMAIGETFANGGHTVQFYRKDNCQPHPDNSGPDENVTTAKALYPSMEFANGIVLEDVLEIGGATESHWGCPGYGRVRWVSQWGAFRLSEVHEPGQRPDVPHTAVCGM